MPDFYTTEEIAEKLGVNIKTVRRWCLAGKLPGAFRIGRDWRIPKDTIDKATEIEKGVNTEAN